MNDLQKLLDAVAVPIEAATEDQWARNRELVGARRRRRRIGGGVVAGLAAAAAVAIAVTWNPSGNPSPCSRPVRSGRRWWTRRP